MKSRYTLCLVALIFLLTNKPIAQNWTPPINVSNANGFIIHSDFTIDNEGVIHCVWDFKFNSNYSVIYYSFSDDEGFTWTEIVNISQNDTNFCTSPQIVHDSQNNIYVGYDLNDYSPATWGSYACMVKKENTGWNEPIIFSEGISTQLAIDKNDRLYVFWFMRAPFYGEFYYQYLEDTTWSDVICPFYNDELTGINEIIVDDSNNLHCAGYHDTTGYNNLYPMYLKYHYSTEQWGVIHDFPEKDQVRDLGITLDTNGFPRMCWGKFGAFYSFYNGENWADTDTITQAEIGKVAIKTDTSNKLHIAITHNYSDIMQLYYYHQPVGTSWISSVIDSADNVIFTPELEIFDNMLYLAYKKSESPGLGDVFLTRQDLITSTKYSGSEIYFNLKNYPNPFKDIMNIEFTINEPEFVSLKIIDINGRVIKTLIYKNLDSGKHIVKWNGTNIFDQNVHSGIYIFLLQIKDKTIENKVIYKRY